MHANGVGNPCEVGKITLKRILRDTEWGGIDWNDLAEDRDWSRALVNTVMNLRVP
jgi:hypothetical protein